MIYRVILFFYMKMISCKPNYAIYLFPDQAGPGARVQDTRCGRGSQPRTQQSWYVVMTFEAHIKLQHNK